MSERDLAPVVLGDGESRDVLIRRILPTWTKDAVRQERPVVVVVCGQPGAGKTLIADLIQAVLDRRGGAVRVGSDLYKPLHRRYAELLAADVRTAGVKVRPDMRRWQAAVEEYIRIQGFDAVIESAAADPDEFRTLSAAYREARCRLEVVALATAEAWSQLGALQRFLTEGYRYVSWENHDRCAKEMLRTLAIIEAEHLADRMTVVRRDGTVLYDNELVDGSWRRRTAADKAVAVGRNMPWTAKETAVFRRELASSVQHIHRVPCEDRRLAVERDSERAAALAEPVRRIAQPCSGPPGVDYHRLSADEHRWVFDELIAPSYLSGIVSRPDPKVVYVLAPPGAGKTQIALMVKRVMRPGTTRLVGDDFKVSHPDYLKLLMENPRGAGAAIRADYRAWFSEAEAYVRAQRGDVVIEAAHGSTAEFLGSALPFHESGYPIELVVIAGREADSLLGTALRYARARQLGIPARFTSRAGFNVCFRALADIVELAQCHPAIAAVTVVRRDGQALLRQERAAGQARRASWALAAEQLRPYTPQEAAQFLALHRAVRKALPQHRAELDDIAALARPLMPDEVQPARIDRTHPSPRLLPLLHPLPNAGYEPSSSFNRAA